MLLRFLKRLYSTYSAHMTNTAAIQSAQITPEAGTFTKRVGYTTYHVGVHFSEASKETAADKIARLIRMEAQTWEAVRA